VKKSHARTSLKILGVLATALLPLGIATAASAGPLGFQSELTGPAFYEPSGVVVASNGDLWISNYSGSSGVVEVSPIDGSVIATVPSTITSVQGLALSNQELYYGSDYTSDLSEISVGPDQSTITGNPTILSTVFEYGSLGVNPTNGYLYLLQNWSSPSIQVFNPVTQQIVSTFNVVSTAGLDAYAPGAFGVTSSGDVVTATANEVYVYDSSGNNVATYSTAVSQPGAVTVDPSGNIWVVDQTGDLQEIVDGQQRPIIPNDSGVCNPTGLASSPSGNIWLTDSCSGVQEYITTPQVTGPDTVTGLGATGVGQSTLRISWKSSDAPDTYYVCTASNGATATVHNNSCTLHGFDLHDASNYTVSVTAVDSQGQSDPATMTIQLQAK